MERFPSPSREITLFHSLPTVSSIPSPTSSPRYFPVTPRFVDCSTPVPTVTDPSGGMEAGLNGLIAIASVKLVPGGTVTL